MNNLIDTFQIHNRINLYLLDAIEEIQLLDVSPSKGRNVGEQFAHLHNVRLLWLKATAPALLNGLVKIEKESMKITKKLLKEELIKSGKAIEQLVTEGMLAGKIKNFKPHPEGFVGYLISHESHHRGQIMLILKICGHAVDKKIMFGIWEWGSR
jgi:uncharacterized damage-inducible protein DinB